MAREESRRRYGRGRRGERQQQGRYSQGQTRPDQYSQDQERYGGRPDWEERRPWDAARTERWAGRPYEEGWQHDYGHIGPQSGYDRDSERDFGRMYRPSWPEQRGGFGEREYGQYDPYQNAGGYGAAPSRGAQREWSGWPEERMGMGTLQPYWSPGLWGGGVPIGAMTGGTGYDYTYERERGGRYGEPPYGGFQGQTGPYPRQGRYGAPAQYPYDRSEGARWAHEGPRTPYPEGAWWGEQDYSGKGPKGYKRTDDRIHEEICERLTKHPAIDASEIEVKVKNGEVTLHGHVSERRYKHLTEDLIENVSGVKDVHNELKVDRSFFPGFKRELRDEQQTRDGRENEEELEEEARGRRERTGAR